MATTVAEIKAQIYATIEPIYEVALPKELFHYTTHEGLIGITSSKRVWATHLRFMNDNREIDDGIALFERAITIAAAENRLGPRNEPFDTWHAEAGVVSALSIGMYAFCLSEKGDDLSQWRAYCASGGYSLGFDASGLSRRVERSRTAELCKVVYDPTRKEKIAEAVVDTAGAAWFELNALPRETKARRLREFAGIILDVVATCVSVFKDQAFSNEAEWRLVASGELSDPGGVRYRPGKSSVVPYVEIPVFRKREPLLRKAIVGPNPDAASALAGMRQCLDDAGFAGVAESVSKVPYRSW